MVHGPVRARLRDRVDAGDDRPATGGHRHPRQSGPLAIRRRRPRAPNGYRNQACGDAHDGVIDENGIFPELPIGTCEMQAYVYAAKLNIAPLFEAWGDRDRAGRLVVEAMELRRRFHESFWLEDRNELAFALDGNKKAVRTVVSNPGHCLWMGILDPRRGRLAGVRLT